MLFVRSILLSADCIEGNDCEDNRGFDYRYKRHRHTSITLHSTRACLECSEEKPCCDDSEWIKSGEKSNGDGGVTIAWRDIFVEGEGHTGELYRPGEPCQGSACKK